jgi:hypothetical protein
MQHHHRWSAALLLLGALGISACAQSEAFDSEAAGDEGPSKVEQVKGSDVARIVLTAQAAERLGIRTTAVTDAGPRRTIPYAAVLYDAEGHTFTYTSPSRLTYVRRPIDVARISGPVALLESGPPAGTAVVTVGAAELLGTEYGVEE